MADASPLMAGKRGIVMGVANARSLAWGVAHSLADHGADLAFTFQGNAIEKRIRPLAESVGSDFVLPLRRDRRGERRCHLRSDRRALGPPRFPSSMQSPIPIRKS